MRALNIVYSSTHAIKQYGKFMHFHFFQSSGTSNIILFLTDGDPTDSEDAIYQAIEEGQLSMVRLTCYHAFIYDLSIFC